MKSFVLNVYKPKGEGSFDIVRRFKRFLGKKYGKVGHFGTLDPFAEGVLMIAFGQAARLNNYVHDLMPKTYLAKGVLGQFTETGDLTSEVTNSDDSDYLKEVIAKFDKGFIQEKLEQEFTGEYWQAPHKYSAAKFEGKKLHQWAREGVEIKKEKKLRHVYSIEVVKYEFPNLWVRVEVSSGTYVRTLFTDFAQYLGTVGVLEDLIREKVGHINIDDSIRPEQWPEDNDWDISNHSLGPMDVLEVPKINANEFQSRLIRNGAKLDLEKHDNLDFEGEFAFILDHEDKMMCLSKKVNNELKVEINFNS